MTISALVIRINVAETETVAAAMESGIIVTGIANGTGTGIGIGMTRVLGSGYAYEGQGAKATILPRATVMTETGGRSGWMVGAGIASRSVTGTGTAIGNDRGDASASVGQAGAHEVLNTEEGMRHDILAGCAPSSVRYELYTYASVFSKLRYSSGLSSRPSPRYTKRLRKKYYSRPGKASRSSIHHSCLPSLFQDCIGALDTKLPTYASGSGTSIACDAADSAQEDMSGMSFPKRGETP